MIKDWAVIEYTQGVVVTPNNDVRPHTADGPQCECNPEVREVEGSKPLVVHASFDGREWNELRNLRLHG